MEIKEVKFEKSSQQASQCPNDKLKDIAFIGRSNVGKSSLINALCNQKDLAKTSSKPGKTQLINHFRINNAWYLVDLPGYGWAQVSKSAKAEFSKLINDYILNRENLLCLFVLIDIRHEPQKIDVEFLRKLGYEGIPFSIIFTKADKLSSNAVKTVVKKYLEFLSEEWEELPPYFITSSQTQRGKAELLEYIEDILNN